MSVENLHVAHVTSLAIGFLLHLHINGQARLTDRLHDSETLSLGLRLVTRLDSVVELLAHSLDLGLKLGDAGEEVSMLMLDVRYAPLLVRGADDVVPLAAYPVGVAVQLSAAACATCGYCGAHDSLPSERTYGSSRNWRIQAALLMDGLMPW